MEKFKDKVKSCPARLVFSEGDDIRVIRAVAQLVKDNLIKEAILIGSRDSIFQNAGSTPLESEKISIIEPEKISGSNRYREKYRTARNLSLLENLIIDEAMKEPVVIGTLLVSLEEADGFIGGLSSTITETLKNGINILKADRRMGIITSFSLIQTIDLNIGSDGLLMIADPTVNTDPSVGVLSKIAEASAKFFRDTLRVKPRIAFLSYSTRGSAEGKSVEKMRVAAQRTRARSPELLTDGELELDAAISPEIAMQKAPDSPLAGKANILIFPNLDSANIGANLINFFGKARLLGPIIFGLNKPFNILTNNFNEMDIYNLAIITQLQVK